MKEGMVCLIEQITPLLKSGMKSWFFIWAIPNLIFNVWSMRKKNEKKSSGHVIFSIILL